MHILQRLPIILLFFLSVVSYGQSLHVTRDGQISFFSKTPLEDIKAVNKKVYSTINTETGAVQFLLKIMDFEFKYSAMQNHFNDEDYMHSVKYPNALFKGVLLNKDSVDFNKPGTYSSLVDGELTMHGVTNRVKARATLVVGNGQITGTAVFNVKLVDYQIKVPQIVFKKIAEVIEVRVNCIYQPFKN
jgi:polyisoprenoid-binding protein YceI